MKADHIPCSCCKGSGRIPLTGIYADTLKIIRRRWVAGYYIVARRDADNWFQCNPTALSNRLKWLERNGLLVSETYGREKRYRPARVGR